MAIHTHARGAAAVSIIAGLVVISLVIVGAVVLSASDSDVSPRRADALRAFYAADAGMNMAVRELMLNIDCDGDGSIGSISADNNSANDPAIGSARTAVTKSITGTTYTITSGGRSGSSYRTIQTTDENLNGGTRWMLYCDWPNATPYVMQWNGRGWGPPSPSLDNGAMIFWALLKRCVPRVELMGATLNNAREIRAMIFDGSAWGHQITLTADAGNRDQRPFYVAYERSSGDGLVAYRDGSNTDVYYRTWNGSAWSGQLTLTSPTAARPRFIKLVPKPSANEIMLVSLDVNLGLFASVWNGSSWGSTITLEPTSAANDHECFDVTYEGTSGRCMVVWGATLNTAVKYCIWDGASWGSVGTGPDVGGVPLWVRATGNPGDNRIALATLDALSDVNAAVWSGSAWSGATELATSASTTVTRAIDIAWEPDGTRALCIYSDNSQWTPYYNLYSSGAWGARQTGPDLTNTPLLLQLDRSQNGKEIVLSAVIYGGQSALTFARWNGTSFANYVMLEGNVSGPTPKEVFMLSDSPPGAVGGSARVTGWTEVAP